MRTSADQLSFGALADDMRERILTQPAPAPPSAGRTTDAIVLKEHELFLLANEAGDIPLEGPHAYGLYLEDCRFLRGFELRVNGGAPTVLGSTVAPGGQTRHELVATGTPEPARSLAVTRRRAAHDEVLVEHLTVRNYGTEVRSVALELRFRPGFEDIFVLKGFATERGRLRAADVDATRRVRFGYEGVDGRASSLSLAFEPPADHLDQERAAFYRDLAPGDELRLVVRIEPRADERRDAAPAAGDARTGPQDGPTFARVETSNALLDAVLARAFADLRLLLSRQDGHHFYEAGVPWFATLFGRDAAITSLQLLAYDHTVARDTLRLLARYQARELDAFRDAEPGKILHELRSGELARAGLIPQSPAYYGSVDATLLFVILLHEYVRWTDDRELLAELAPALDAAVEWSLGIADHDGDGYIDYSGRYGTGLINQGWKDSGNAIVNADGSLARPPVALCEVQSYAYRAWRGAAALLSLSGEGERASALRHRADELRERFERDFWWEGEGVHQLALQREHSPTDVVSSNAGQVLWGGVTSRERAARIAERLQRPDLWSGWGIRTLSSATAAYDPASYHCGTVWPHDNALILAGLRRYGEDAAALRVFNALFTAATGFRDRRLPELWSGYARETDDQRPVGYPVACVPQAWAAGALPYALTALLGLEPLARERRLVVRRPVLPEGVDELTLAEVPLGDARLQLRFTRTATGTELEPVTSDGVTVERTDELGPPI